jgi:hypothetical protein
MLHSSLTFEPGESFSMADRERVSCILVTHKAAVLPLPPVLAQEDQVALNLPTKYVLKSLAESHWTDLNQRCLFVYHPRLFS